MKSADFYILCTPEKGPVDQMFKVGDLVKVFGGNVKGYVVNNNRGERQEAEQIERVKERSGGRPVIEIAHNQAISECDDSRALYKSLRDIGRRFDF